MSFKLFIEPTERIIVNVVVTFVQSFIATWSATGFQADKLAFAGAIGAGLSAVWNLVIKPNLVREGWLKG